MKSCESNNLKSINTYKTKNKFLPYILGVSLSVSGIVEGSDKSNFYNEIHNSQKYSEYTGSIKIKDHKKGKTRLCNYSQTENKGREYIITAKHCINGKKIIFNTNQDIIKFDSSVLNGNLIEITSSPKNKVKNISHFNSTDIVNRSVYLNILNNSYESTVMRDSENKLFILLPMKLFKSLDGYSGTPIFDEFNNLFGVLSGSKEFDNHVLETIPELKGLFPLLIAPINK